MGILSKLGTKIYFSTNIGLIEDIGLMIDRLDTDKPAAPENHLDNQEKRNDIHFKYCLLLAAAYADGKIESEEERLLNQFIEKLHNELEKDNLKEFKSKLMNLKSNISQIDFKYLKDSYDSTKNSTTHKIIENSKKEKYRKIVADLTSADNFVTDPERAFRFKCELLFEDLDDVQVFKITKFIPNNSGNFLKYISQEEIKTEYPETEFDYINFDSFYTPHPKNHRQLVPFEVILSEKFITTIHTELIQAAQEAGATSVTIETIDKELSHNSDKSSIGTQINKGITEIDASVRADLVNILEAQSSSVTQYTFTGKTTSYFEKIKSMVTLQSTGADKVINDSVYLKHNPDLIRFVQSCFSENKVKNFEYELTCTEEADAQFSANLAAKCSIAKTGKVGVEAEYEKKHKTLKNRSIRYKISFE